MSPESRALSTPPPGGWGVHKPASQRPRASHSASRVAVAPPHPGRVQFRSWDTQVSRTGAGLKEGLSRYHSNGDTVLALS